MLNFENLETKEELLNSLKITEDEYKQAVAHPYKSYYIKHDEKRRLVEEPTIERKNVLFVIGKLLQEIEPPPFYQYGWKGLSNITNCKIHRNRLETVTLDIARYFPNTQEKYIRKFFENDLNIIGEALDMLLKLIVCEGHLPTGAPTSPILACLVHKPLFTAMYRKMKKHGITMTVYADDITLSSYKHIGNWVIKYIQKVLKMHGLWLNKSKTKHFGYKLSWVTGIGINQSGQLLVPFRMDHAVVKMLRAKNLEDMNVSELQKLLGVIGYIQQIAPSRFRVTKQKARKRLRQLIKII